MIEAKKAKNSKIIHTKYMTLAVMKSEFCIKSIALESLINPSYGMQHNDSFIVNGEKKLMRKDRETLFDCSLRSHVYIDFDMRSDKRSA